MTGKEFALSLSNELIKRGVSKETVIRHVVSLTRTLTKEDLEEIAAYHSPEDFTELSDGIAVLLRQNDEDMKITPPRATQFRNTSIPDENMKTQKINVFPEMGKYPSVRKREIEQNIDDTGMGDVSMMKTRTDTSVSASAFIDSAQLIDDDDINAFTNIEADTQVTLTSRGRGFFWMILLLTLPLTLSVATLIFGIFALCFAGVIGLIALCFGILIGEVMVGSGAALIGMIYGVIQMFSSAGIGIYEFGIGVVCAGVTLLAGILTYHLGTIVLPYVVRQLAMFFRHCMRQLRPLADRFKEECNRL